VATDDDYGQATTIVQRLGEALALLNPVTLLQTLSTVVREIATPPPGDPDDLSVLAQAFRSAAGSVAPVAEDVRSLGSRQLPEVWHGLAATSATQVVTASTAVVDATPTVFGQAAAALEELAEQVREQQRRHGELHQALRDAVHDVTHLAGLPIPDPFALDDLVAAAAGLVRGCIGVYTDAITSADRAAGAFADVAGQARAAAGVAGGLGAADAVVLAAETVGIEGDGDGDDDDVLTSAQLACAGESLDAMPVAERARVQGLLDQAGSTTEQAYLLKVVVAGHSGPELDRFAGAIRGKPPTWLHNHLTLLDRGGPVEQTRFGADVDQYDDYTCGTTSLIVSRAETDPLYAFRFTEGLEDPVSRADKDEFDRRLSAEQNRVHDATNLIWPQWLGTSPHGMADWMNQQSAATGVHYDHRLVDDTDHRDVSGALRDVVTAVDRGHPVPILVGGPIPRHYVIVVGHEGDHLLIFDPAYGRTVQVPSADFVDGRMGEHAGFDHVQAVVVPQH